MLRSALWPIRPWSILACSVALVACASNTEPSGDARSTAGSDAGGDAGASQVSYAADVQPIWDSYCVGCHGTTGVSPTLTARFSYGALQKSSQEACVDGKSASLVVPGDPDASFLMYKVTGSSKQSITPGGCARTMPANKNGDERLIDKDAAAVQTIRAWIEAGAPND